MISDPAVARVVEAARDRAAHLRMVFSGQDQRTSEDIVREGRDTDHEVMDSVDALVRALPAPEQPGPRTEADEPVELVAAREWSGEVHHITNTEKATIRGNRWARRNGLALVEECKRLRALLNARAPEPQATRDALDLAALNVAKFLLNGDKDGEHEALAVLLAGMVRAAQSGEPS